MGYFKVEIRSGKKIPAIENFGNKSDKICQKSFAKTKLTQDRCHQWSTRPDP